jgi:hypothetical protein
VKIKWAYIQVMTVLLAADAYSTGVEPHANLNNDYTQISDHFRSSRGMGTIRQPVDSCTRGGTDPFGRITAAADECGPMIPGVTIGCEEGDCAPPKKERFFYFPKNQ